MSDYIAIGEGDGNYIYLMLKSEDSKKVFIYDSISIAVENSEPSKVFESFKDFFKQMQSIEIEDEVLDDCKIVLTNPITDIRMILKIKKNFQYNDSLLSLKSGCMNPPFVIKKNITRSIAETLIRKSPELSDDLKIISCKMQHE